VLLLLVMELGAVVAEEKADEGGAGVEGGLYIIVWAGVEVWKCVYMYLVSHGG
jgi:hypothetical protein